MPTIKKPLSAAINFRLPQWLYEELRKRVYERKDKSLNQAFIRLVTAGWQSERAKTALEGLLQAWKEYEHLDAPKAGRVMLEQFEQVMKEVFNEQD